MDLFSVAREERASEGVRSTERLSTRTATSDAAYATAQTGSVRDAVLAMIAARPRTCDEIVQEGHAHQSASAAINWLMRRGIVVDSGLRRRTATGRSAIVWECCDRPVPVSRSSPTRRQMQERIEAALSLLREDAAPPERRIAYAIAILSGEATQ